jgi:hypothetical protein
MRLLSIRARRACQLVACLGVASIAPFAAAGAQDSSTVRLVAPIEIHGFVEVYYRTGDPTTKDGYRLRKGDLKFSGDLSPRLRWRIGFDAGKALALDNDVVGTGDTARLAAVAVDQKSRIVQDAAITMTFNRAFVLDVGQQLIPLSLEGTIPSPNVETIERTMFIVERSRGVGLGDVRDIGASVNGFAPFGLEYHAGLFNETGESQGATDTNDQKAFIARAAYHPTFLPAFEIGASGAAEGGPIEQKRGRFGTEIQYRDPRVTFRAETMAARDGELRRFGWYGLGAYRPTPPLQLVVRYDSWDRDRTHEASLNDAYEQQIIAGASYLIDGNTTRLMLNLVRQNFPNISTVRIATFALIAFECVW